MVYSNWSYDHYQDQNQRRPRKVQTLRSKLDLKSRRRFSTLDKTKVASSNNEKNCAFGLLTFGNLNKIRRIIYVGIFMVSFGFFTYFIYDFYVQYKQYPMVINVEVIFPTDITLPAISACYNHPLMKSKACALEKYVEQCRKNETLDLVDTVRNSSTKEFEDMRQTPKSLFKFFNVTGFGGFVENDIHLNSSWSHRGLHSCFTANEQWQKSPLRRASGIKQLYYYFQMIMNPNETLGKVRTRQGIVYIHSPFAIPFETEAKVRVNPGYFYEVTASQTRILLLEPPYKTACRNYSRAWEMSNRTIPYIGRYNCLVDCRIKLLMKQCGCVPARVHIVTKGVKKCVGSFAHCYNETFEKNLTVCENLCPNRCDLDVYDIKSNRFKLTDVTEMFQCQDKDCEQNTAVVHLYVETFRQLVYNHSPKLQTMEILGFVGGYMGIFLGMSIPAIYQFFDYYAFLSFYRCQNKQSEFKQMS